MPDAIIKDGNVVELDFNSTDATDLDPCGPAKAFGNWTLKAGSRPAIWLTCRGCGGCHLTS